MNSHINMNPMDGLEGDILPEFLDDKITTWSTSKIPSLLSALNWATEGALRKQSKKG